MYKFLLLSGEPSVSIPDNHIQCESGDQVMIPCNHSSDSTVSRDMFKLFKFTDL